MGIPQPKVSRMMNGDFINLSERKLMDCLNRLGYDIEIKVRPAAASVAASDAYHWFIRALKEQFMLGEGCRMQATPLHFTQW